MGELPEVDVTPVDVCDRVSNDVFEVEPAFGPFESARAAALNDGVVAAPMKLYPARHVWIPLRRELVRCRERTHGSAIEAADEDLFTTFQIHARRRFLSCDDLRIQAAFEAARHHKSWISSEIFIASRRAGTLHRVVIRSP